MSAVENAEEDGEWKGICAALENRLGIICTSRNFYHFLPWIRLQTTQALPGVFSAVKHSYVENVKYLQKSLDGCTF